MNRIGLLLRLRKGFKALVSKDHSETPAFWGGLLIEILGTFFPQVIGTINTALAFIPGVSDDFSVEKLVPFLITYATLRFTGKVMDPSKVK